MLCSAQFVQDVKQWIAGNVSSIIPPVTPPAPAPSSPLPPPVSGPQSPSVFDFPPPLPHFLPSPPTPLLTSSPSAPFPVPPTPSPPPEGALPPFPLIPGGRQCLVCAPQTDRQSECEDWTYGPIPSSKYTSLTCNPHRAMCDLYSIIRLPTIYLRLSDMDGDDFVWMSDCVLFDENGCTDSRKGIHEATTELVYVSILQRFPPCAAFYSDQYDASTCNTCPESRSNRRLSSSELSSGEVRTEYTGGCTCYRMNISWTSIRFKKRTDSEAAPACPDLHGFSGSWFTTSASIGSFNPDTGIAYALSTEPTKIGVVSLCAEGESIQIMEIVNEHFDLFTIPFLFDPPPSPPKSIDHCTPPQWCQSIPCTLCHYFDEICCL